VPAHEYDRRLWPNHEEIAMGDIDAVLARLEQLEAENRALRARVDQLKGTSAEDDPVAGGGFSRRDVLRRAGTGAVALGIGVLGASVATLAQASPALAANGDTVTVGGTFDGSDPTVLRNLTNTRTVLGVQSGSSGTAIAGGSASGEGVFGSSDSLYGVHGTSNSATGVYGDTLAGTGVQGDAHGAGTGMVATSDSGNGLSASSTSGAAINAGSESGPGIIGSSTSDIGVTGISDSRDGVQGFSTKGDGVSGMSQSALGRGVIGTSQSATGGTGAWGESSAPDGAGVRGYAWDGSQASGHFGTGVIGSSGSHATPPRPLANTGVMGVGFHGRGGVFQGDLAQIRLVASSALTHPTSGTRGDLFVDKAGRLWFCRSGTNWRQLA